MASWTVSHTWGRYENVTAKLIFDQDTHPDAIPDARAETRRLMREVVSDLFGGEDTEATVLQSLDPDAEAGE